MPDTYSEILKAVKDDTKQLAQKALQDDFKTLADWISPSTYPAEHSAKLRERQEGTGGWFVRLSEVNTWLNTPKSTLLCHGELGTGKSMLSAILIKHSLKTVKTELVGVAWVFIRHKAKLNDAGEDHTKAELLAALLKQLMQSHTKIEEYMEHQFRDQIKEESGISEYDTVKMLDFWIPKLSTTYIVVDALDESIDTPQRDQFVEYLQSLKLSADVRILITSQFVTTALQSAP